MSDVILFRPKVLKGKAKVIRPRPPLGLLFIAAPLVKNNYDVKIIDEESSFCWQDELGAALNSSTICVGITSMTGNQISNALKFSRIVKDRFNIPVVWGGLHATMLPEQTIKNNLVDIVVKGEGEESFLRIVTALKCRESLNNIPNVWWKEGSTVHSNDMSRRFININEISPLPYHLLNCESYINVKRSSHPNCKRIFDLHTDRGCPHRCGFCYNINMNERIWRAFTADRIVEQIEYLIKNFSLDGINFLGDNFFVDKKRVIDICNEIVKRNIKFIWHADCRIDYFAKYDNSFIDLLKKSGCKVLTFGVESGSQKILNLINKDINLDDVFKVNEKLKKWQIGVNYHFMAGFPEETKEDLIQTYRVMLKLCDKYPGALFLGPSIYTPYPGTPLFDKCIEMGFGPPDKLEDWAEFGWTENTRLPFIEPNYSRWLMRTVNVVNGVNVLKRIFDLKWIRQWFKIRIKFIIEFNIIGPQVEERLINLAETVITIIKNLGNYKKFSPRLHH